MLAWIAFTAAAQDEPHLWVRGFGAIAVNPSGVIIDVAGEVRAPVLRFGGAVFNDTFVGVGARVAASPAHLDTAVRVSVQPIDILPVTVEAFRTTYWNSPWGLLPMDQVDDTSNPFRTPLYQAGHGFSGGLWAVSVNPTLQLKVGPVIAFTSPIWTFAQTRPVVGPEPWVYEPYRGLVVAYDDRILEHTSAVLVEPLDGEDRALLRIGPVFRGKDSAATPDRTLALGGLVQWRPGRDEANPTLTALATGYLVDPDFLGPIPYVAVLASIADTALLGRSAKMQVPP